MAEQPLLEKILWKPLNQIRLGSGKENMKVLCKKFFIFFFSWANEIQFRAVEVRMVTYQSLQEFQSGSGLDHQYSPQRHSSFICPELLGRVTAIVVQWCKNDTKLIYSKLI
jgi:hypothetical protein